VASISNDDPRLVWVLQHVHTRGEDDEDVKFIGVYSSEESGRAAIDHLSTKPGFAATVEGFDLSKYELDRTWWEEGFVTIPNETEEED
jgi:homoserine kinase type II